MELQQRGGDVSRSDRHSGDVSALNRERGVEPSLDSKEKSSSSQWCRQTDETDSTRGRREGGKAWRPFPPQQSLRSRARGSWAQRTP